jgi:hypothetical protein
VRQPSEQVAEPLGALVGGQQQRGHDEVSRRVVELVGEHAQRGGQPLALEAGRQPDDLGADRHRCDPGGGDDRLLEAARAGHGVAQHLGPGRDALDPVELGLALRLTAQQARRQEPGGAHDEGGHRPAGHDADHDGERHAQRQSQHQVLEPVLQRRPLGTPLGDLVDGDRPQGDDQRHHPEGEHHPQQPRDQRHRARSYPFPAAPGVLTAWASLTFSVKLAVRSTPVSIGMGAPPLIV